MNYPGGKGNAYQKIINLIPPHRTYIETHLGGGAVFRHKRPARSRHGVILSLFPNIGLLDRAFEEHGLCVVRGPDTLWGGDIRSFAPPPDIFWGVIAGSPCQDFSKLRRTKPTGYGKKMIDEFIRVIDASQPEWWLLENVAGVPDISIDGYADTQRLPINQGWYCDVSRLRHIQFSSKSGVYLNIPHQRLDPTVTLRSAALANDNRSFRELCDLQGLPPDFDLPPFKVREKKRAVGNGVPLPIGRVLAQAIIAAYRARSVTLDKKLCPCGCRRPVTGKATYAGDETGNTDACRKRAQRKRDRAARKMTKISQV